jgi:membrane protein involved in colicin uptake
VVATRARGWGEAEAAVAPIPEELREAAPRNRERLHQRNRERLLVVPEAQMAEQQPRERQGRREAGWEAQELKC